MIAAWTAVAEAVYEMRSNNHKSNFNHVKRIFKENEALLAALMSRCPTFMIILAHILEDKFGFRVRNVSFTSAMTDWEEEESKRVGCSLATFLRNRKTGEHAVDAWRRNYVQLEELFTEVIGFEAFMLTLANNTLQDSVYGTVYRVSVGAFLSMTDAATDIYVISTCVNRAKPGRASEAFEHPQGGGNHTAYSNCSASRSIGRSRSNRGP